MIKNNRCLGIIRTLMILPVLIGPLYACATGLKEKPPPESKIPTADNFTVQKKAPPEAALTLPRGDEPRSMTFFQQKLYDPDNKPDACKQYALTFTQDKILWNWIRKNCQS